MANFHYDVIVFGKTDLCQLNTFESLLIHAMVYDEPLKHFISVTTYQYTMLPFYSLQAPKWPTANFHSNMIVCVKTDLCQFVTIESLFVHTRVHVILSHKKHWRIFLGQSRHPIQERDGIGFVAGASRDAVGGILGFPARHCWDRPAIFGSDEKITITLFFC